MGSSRQQNPPDNTGPHPHDLHVLSYGKKASNTIEILTGSDALHFLCSNSDKIGKNQSCMKKSNAFTTLFSETKARDSAMAPMTSSASLQYPAGNTSKLSSSRQQRKAHKPSRVPPPEEEPTLPTLNKSVVTDDHTSLKTMLNCSTTQDDYTLSKKKSGISSKSSATMKDNHEDLSMVRTTKGNRNKRQSSPCDATIVCKNLACKAVLRAGASFCRRCSCCICKEFDDNKDPSLWITCDAEEQEGCGLSCHVECALQDGVAGVSNKGGPVSLDGSFVCRSCDKVSSLLGLWKKQLLVAKNARRVDVLCHRLLLSHRLLKGTEKYRHAHTPIDNAVGKLEAEVHLMNKGSAKLERCIVNRLSCNIEVQKLIDLALEQVESLCDAQGTKTAGTHEKAFSSMQFEDVCSSSIVVVVDNHPCDNRPGYKLWHRKATDLSYPAAPTYTIQSTSRKVLVSNLQPCTSYAFKLSPFSKGGDGEECEAECCTEDVESTVVENHVNDDISGCVHGVGHTNHAETKVVQIPEYHSSTVFQFMQQGRTGKQGGAVEDLSGAKTSSTLLVYEVKDNHSMEPGDVQKGLAVPNERQTSSRKDVCETTELPPHRELEKEKEEVFVIRDAFESLTVARTANVDIMDNSNPASQNWSMKFHCNDARTGTLSRGEVANNGEDGTSHGNNFMFPVRVIRWLERLGHLDKEFRMKFLTWYSLRAVEHEKRVVSVFIDTLQDSPASLAAQLVDAFEDVINSKRQRVEETGYYRRLHQKQ